MSGLFGNLANGVKALNAQSIGLQTAGRNLANVNNASYARQRVVFGDRGTVVTPLGPQSLGVEALAVTQIRDALLDQQVVREIATTADLETIQSGLQKAQAGLGQSVQSATSTTTGVNGIAETMTEFFNSFKSYAATPTDVGEKQTLIQQAGILVDRINLTDSRLVQTQSDLTTLAQSDVTEVNTIGGFVRQIGMSSLPDEQKVLQLRRALPLAKSANERRMIIRSLQRSKTFQAFLVASSSWPGGVPAIVEKLGDDPAGLAIGAHGAATARAAPPRKWS